MKDGIRIMNDLKSEYMFQKDAALYLHCTQRKIALYRKYGMLKCAKLGKNYVYKKSWLDDFMEQWSNTDLSNETKIRLAINARKWHETHDMK